MAATEGSVPGGARASAGVARRLPGRGLRRRRRAAPRCRQPAGRARRGRRLPLESDRARHRRRRGGRRARRRPATDRALPDPRHDRARGHGHGLPGGARRRRVPQDRRAEAGPGRAPLRLLRAALPPGATDPGAPPASQHRHRARRRDDRGRPALPGDGVRGGPADHRLLRGAGLGIREPPGPVPYGVRRRPVRPSEPGDPPRHQAGERAGGRPRRPEAARLRHRQAARVRRRSRPGADRHRRSR